MAAAGADDLFHYTLFVCSLNGNQIGDVGASALAEAVKNNGSLQMLR